MRHAGARVTCTWAYAIAVSRRWSGRRFP
jgi:hypothetical protein